MNNTYQVREVYPAQELRLNRKDRRDWNRRANSMYSRKAMLERFTGNGGLHSIKRTDFESFGAYSRAKQRLEKGQFFTPLPLCRAVVEMLEIEPGSTVADICCGKGSFFNYLDGCRVQGVEVDAVAARVARRLFPKAAIQWADMRRMKPLEPCDYIVGNPPYNLELSAPGHLLANTNGKVISQALYLEKCFESLKPGGLLAMVAPHFKRPSRYLKADWNKLAAYVRERFDTVAVVELPRDAFEHLGVRDFPTKIVVYRKKGGCAQWSGDAIRYAFTDSAELLKTWRGSPQYAQMKRAKCG